MDDSELKRLIEGSAADTRHHFDVVAEGLRKETADTRRHFDVVAEGLRKDVQLVAEGVVASGQRTDRLTGRIEQIERGIRGEFEETRSMIRLSYTELDRRLRTLEETVSTIQARVDRLESGSPQ